MRSPTPSGTSSRRAVLAATIGNALEWFDLIIYAFFANAIAKAFFPNPDSTLSLLMALGTFGVSFVVRPLGGVVLGAYADRAGRKAALVLGMSLMMIGTALMALTPGADDIGLAAPVLIVIARLLQGFSAGGEFASATTFLAEQSPDRRCFNASWQFASQGFAMVMGACFGYGVTMLLGPEETDAWGWRIPFVFGMLIGPVAIYIRRHVDETSEFRATVPTANPISEAIRNRKASMLMALGAVILSTVAIYLMLYMPTYGTRLLELDSTAGFLAALAGGAVLFLLTPHFGRLADRLGQFPVAFPAAVVLVVLPVPLFAWLLDAPSALRLVVVQTVFATALSAYLGVLGALMTDLFPTASRSTGVSLSYNLSVMTFGGMAPLLMTWLISSTGWLAIPAYYLALAALVSVVAVLAVRQRRLQAA